MQHDFTSFNLISGPMGHDHRHHGEERIASAFWINLIFSVIEIAGGFMTNSISILSDALHDLGDSLSLGMAWYFQKVSKKKRDDKYTYGYRRFTLLGAVINAVILLSGSLLIITTAIPRMANPQPTHSVGMIVLAILGISFNGLAYFRLSHGHSHNEKVVSLHLLEDVLGWVAVLMGGAIIHFTGWFIIDPILSILIAGFIIFNVFRHIRSSWRILLQGIPSHFPSREVSRILSSHDDVISFHDLHLWSMDGENGILTVHIVIDADTPIQKRRTIKDQIQQSMMKIGIDHCTIEIEHPSEHCVLKSH